MTVCGIAFKVKMPIICVNVVNKSMLVSEAGIWDNKIWKWHIVWRRKWFEWEKPIFYTLMDELQRIQSRLQLGDIWIWKPGQNEKYLVQSAYDVITQVNR